MIITIYEATCLVNGKKYVGQTSQPLLQRWRQHCAKSSTCTYFDRAIKKHGVANFSLRTVFAVSTQEEADEIEQRLIRDGGLLVPSAGYNIAKGGLGNRLIRFCKRGHDLDLPQARRVSGHCRLCRNAYVSVRNKAIRAEKGPRYEKLVSAQRKWEEANREDTRETKKSLYYKSKSDPEQNARLLRKALKNHHIRRLRKSFQYSGFVYGGQT